MDLALNNLQSLICHKTQQTKPNHLTVSKQLTALNETICVQTLNSHIYQPLGVVAIEKKAFWWPSTTVANFYCRQIKKCSGGIIRLCIKSKRNYIDSSRHLCHYVCWVSPTFLI